MIDRLVAIDKWLGEDNTRFAVIVAISGVTGGILFYVTRGISVNLYYAYLGILGVLIVAIGGISLLLYRRRKI